MTVKKGTVCHNCIWEYRQQRGQETLSRSKLTGYILGRQVMYTFIGIQYANTAGLQVDQDSMFQDLSRIIMPLRANGKSPSDRDHSGLQDVSGMAQRVKDLPVF